MLARNSNLAPLNCCDWPSLPSHDAIWKYILGKYIVAEEGRKCILEIVGKCWCLYKCRVKKRYYYAFDTNDARWKNRPNTIPDAHFKDLLKYWDIEPVEEISNKNRISRQQAHDLHTLGPNSLALMRHELQQEDPKPRFTSSQEQGTPKGNTKQAIRKLKRIWKKWRL